MQIGTAANGARSKSGDPLPLRALGWNLNQSGRPEEAIPVLKKALRLNPFPRSSYFLNLGIAYRMTGR
jgi:tetratricopeptide (TPR) repeat protein